MPLQTAIHGLKNHPTNLPSASHPQLSHFNARQLLDPKGYKSAEQKKGRGTSTEDKDSLHTPPTVAASNGSHKRIAERDAHPGLGSLIERVHNVNEREGHPRKKQRTEIGENVLNENIKPSFGGGGKGGEIGDYMREKRKEGQTTPTAISTVVDLTGGDDDGNDEIVVLKESDDVEVCYGLLSGAKVLAYNIPKPRSGAVHLSKGEWPPIKLKLRRLPGKDNIIQVLDPTGNDFGKVDPRTSIGLAPILQDKNLKCRAQATLTNRKRKPDEIPGSGCSEFMNMIINLYGPKSKAVMIGRFLSLKQIHLGAPFLVDIGIKICNPHAPKTNVVSKTSSQGTSFGSGVGYVSRTLEEIRSDVLGMFNSLQESESLPEMEPSPLIVTKLLSHQKQGLHFMMSKEMNRVFSDREEENSSLWRLKYGANGQRTYYDVITGKEERTKPPEVLGGILADMMGLGKTLSILSLILTSLEQSIDFAKQLPPDEDGQLVRNSGSTLLVSPLSTIGNWEEQIATHVKPGSLKYYIFHGGNRCQEIDELASYDLIITTYSIVSSEFYGRGKKKDSSPLFATHFFRIVLDEAHMIREQATRQSQAICALASQRRWAVTGTPVQNRLDDLGALIKFLRVKPFSEKGGFAQYILSPFKSADPEILPKLRLLVNSITLRRLKDRIDLPARRDEIVRLSFTDEESELYEWFAKDSDQKMRIIAGEKRKSLGGRTYVHILRAIMRLRLICAHGRDLLNEDDLKILEGRTSSNAIDLDDDQEKPSLNVRQAYEMLMLLKETGADTCAQCARTVGVSELENTSDGKDVIGYMLPCYQIVCNDCKKDLCSLLQQAEDHFTCPFCDQRVQTSLFELSQEGLDATEEAKNQARMNPKRAKILGRYSGPHTKTRALVEALHASKAESEDLPPDKPIKSVVFSGWTAHLDLIQLALEESSIQYVRLDGKMTRAKRNAALDHFREDPNITVIIISISAGGLGLNLTTASKVYVMEPQFNPAAEAQAVDRVHRLGQTREVSVIRFIMKNSFEERMLALQRKKENLAELSMNRGKLDKAEAAKQRLEELRSLFK